MSNPETVKPGDGTPPDVASVLSNLVGSIGACPTKPTACVVLMLDGALNWAGATSGLSLDELARVLLVARDDALRGGNAFTVVVNDTATPDATH